MRINQLIGVPCNLGANRVGIEFSIEELIKHYPDTFKDIDVLPIERQSEDFTNPKMKYFNTILDTCEKLAIKTQAYIKKGVRPITIGGDHSLALGSISGVAVEKNIGVIWVDAHGDMNTEEITESGHIHGMPLAALLGHGNKKLTNLLSDKTKIKVQDTIVIGTRDLDTKEEALMQEIGLKYIPYEVIKKQGLSKTLEEVKAHLKVAELHISFDIDSLDPTIAPGVSTPVPSGFSLDDAHKIFQFLFANYNISSIDIVEFNPVNDPQQKTLKLAHDIITYVQTL